MFFNSGLWIVSLPGTNSWLRKLAGVCSRRSCWGEEHYFAVTQCSCREGLLQRFRWGTNWRLPASDQTWWPRCGLGGQLGRLGGTGCQDRASGGDGWRPEKHAGLSPRPSPHRSPPCREAVLSLLLLKTLVDPMDCNPSRSSVHGILQARILEWVAIPFFRGSSQPRDWTQVSRIADRFFTPEPLGKPQKHYCLDFDVLMILFCYCTKIFWEIL